LYLGNVFLQYLHPYLSVLIFDEWVDDEVNICFKFFCTARPDEGELDGLGWLLPFSDAFER